MRGKGTIVSFVAANPRITPAYAGKRYRNARSGQYQRDHPRVCGEKAFMAFCRNCAVGSPPRMRGKVCFLGCISVLTGITPAYAGKSGRYLQRGYGGKDHPRVCGEKLTTFDAGKLIPGSPPRMRGKAQQMIDAERETGITPAYAGKRLKRSRSTVPPVAIVPLFPSVCNKPVVSDGSPAGRDAPLFLPAENAVPASPAYNLRSL